MTQSAVEISDLSVVFRTPRGEVKALDSLTLKVEAGQVFAFLGPNGAGKTTTMHVLLGFVEATSGSARIMGQDVRTAIARRRIGYLAENPDTYHFLTGRELLELTGRLFLMSRTEIRSRMDDVLGCVELSREVVGRKIATYSRGMKQRICLAQALINDPDLVILDEPTGGLDPLGRMGVRRIIADLRARGKTVFFSSHELSEAELVCDRVAIISRGRTVASGAMSDLVRPGESLEQFFMRTVA